MTFVEWQIKWADDLEWLTYEERVKIYEYMLDGIDIDMAKAMAANVDQGERNGSR